jgi:hypothetical protein
MAREPKVMFSARLPGDLVGQIVEVAEEEGISQGELVEQVMAEWLDEHALSGTRWGVGGGGGPRWWAAPRAGLKSIARHLEARGRWPATVVVGCMHGEDGVIIGPQGDPQQLLADVIRFTTIAAAAAGKRLRIIDGRGDE